MPDSAWEFISEVSLFDGLPKNALREIAERGSELTFQRGDVICRQGDPGSSMFIIKSGVIQVFVEISGEKRVLAHLHRGEYFGEMSLLSGLPRSASVAALAETRVLGLTKDDFEDVCRKNVDIALDIIKTLSIRLSQSNLAQKREDAARVVVLLSLERGLGRSTLAANLAVMLSDMGKGRVGIYDPRLGNRDLAAIFGIDAEADLHSPLVRSSRLDLKQYLLEPRPNLVMLPPQVESGPPLQEFHHYIPFRAFCGGVGVLVVDSSSTVAGLNREIIKAAHRVVLLVSSSNDDIEATIDQVDRMVLSPARVGKERVVLALLQRDGRRIDVPDGLVGDIVEIPEFSAGFDNNAIIVESEPGSDFTKAVGRLAGVVTAGERIELYVPYSDTMSRDEFLSSLEKVLKPHRNLFPEARDADYLPDGTKATGSTGGFRVLLGSFDEESLREGFGGVIDLAGEIKEKTCVEKVFLCRAGDMDLL